MVVRLFAPEDGSGGAAPAPASPAPAPAATAPVASPATPEAPRPEGSAAASSPPVRPDWLPEKFFDVEKGAPRLEDLGKSYAELERKLHTRTDDLKRQVADEFKSSQFKDRPEKPEDYQVKAPDGFLPEGVELRGNPNDPLFKTASRICHDAGIGQDGFSQLVAAYVESQAMAVPDRGAELAKLGQNAPDRLRAVETWARANIPARHFAFFEAISDRAEAIEALEWMQATLGEPRQGGSVTSAPNGPMLTQEKLLAMQQDPRYWNPSKRDDRFVAQVDNGYKQLYG